MATLTVTMFEADTNVRSQKAVDIEYYWSNKTAEYRDKSENGCLQLQPGDGKI